MKILARRLKTREDQIKASIAQVVDNALICSKVGVYKLDSNVTKSMDNLVDQIYEAVMSKQSSSDSYEPSEHNDTAWMHSPWWNEDKV